MWRGDSGSALRGGSAARGDLVRAALGALVLCWARGEDGERRGLEPAGVGREMNGRGLGRPLRCGVGLGESLRKEGPPTTPGRRRLGGGSLSLHFDGKIWCDTGARRDRREWTKPSHRTRPSVAPGGRWEGRIRKWYHVSGQNSWIPQPESGRLASFWDSVGRNPTPYPVRGSWGILGVLGFRRLPGWVWERAAPPPWAPLRAARGLREGGTQPPRAGRDRKGRQGLQGPQGRNPAPVPRRDWEVRRNPHRRRTSRNAKIIAVTSPK